MGGNTGVRRDVLRWVVALNLSFPIKNVKRDFSNGFLVAEIFSRYFPHDIQMHSFDYGIKMEKKRDNWTQLQKFFKKRSFVVMKDEIETIISCQTLDGACPLLERMYKFLTMKRCKPVDVEAEKEILQPHTQKITLESKINSIMPPDYIMPLKPLETNNKNNKIECSIKSPCPTTTYTNVQRDSLMCSCTRQGPPCFNRGCQRFIRLNKQSCESLNSTQREASCDQFENVSRILLPLESNVSFNNTYSAAKNSSPHEIHLNGDENHEKGQGVMCLSALERARQHEMDNNANCEKKILKVDHNDGAIINNPWSRTTSSIALAFRNPHRQRNFKQYTINDYRRQQTASCAHLGKLGADLEDEELGEKRQKLERMKEFSRIVRTCNTAQVNVPKKIKTPPLTKRQKALEFATTVPRPKVKKVEVENPPTPKKNHHHLSELQVLEAKHEADRQHVEAMRRELEIFLR